MMIIRRRIVVKIGSSSLTTSNGELSREKISEHVKALAKLREYGHEVVLISSGAVAAGFGSLGYPIRPVTVAGRQSSAAVGQGLLMQAYAEEFDSFDIVVGQLLVTRDDFADKERYSNIYQTLSELLSRGAIPIINENDCVSIDELTFGDNDMLSSLISGLIHADFLIILTDINGIYDSDPRKNPQAKKYHFLPRITEQLEKQASGSGSKVGTGGMQSKIEAAKTALSLGVNLFIGCGEGENKLVDILLGKGDGTYLGYPNQTSLTNKKQWISLHSVVSGQVMIDKGAEEAILKSGKSLLPAGITKVNGDFLAGEVVEIINQNGKIIGKGEVHYSSAELEMIKGLQSEEAKSMTNRTETVAIHRDYLILLEGE
ncbi:MAG TPA: glutamate 5-kinase [Massilibacterium sp.]|nr:glutamate 5-kinase [Massilibacterium sp.]